MSAYRQSYILVTCRSTSDSGLGPGFDNQRCIARAGLTWWAECLQECHQRGGFRWRKVLAIRRHIASALQHLADQLVSSKASRNSVERRAALTAFAAEAWQLRHCLA